MLEDVMKVVCKVDYHCHTYHSPCGQPEMIPEVVLKTAEERGIEVMGLTDHYRQIPTRFEDFAKVREECAGYKGSVRVLFGCEAEVITPERISITEEEASRFEYVLLSASHFPAVKEVMRPETNDPEVVAQHFLRMFRCAAATPFIDIIPHPFFVVPNSYDPLSPTHLTDAELLEVIELMRQNEIAIEISPRALTPEQTPFFLRFYKLCKNVGLKFSIGSDSHRFSTFGRNHEFEPIIRELELTLDDLWHPKGIAFAK